MKNKKIVLFIALISALICVAPIMAAEENALLEYALFDFNLFGSGDSALKIDSMSLQQINSQHTDVNGKTDKHTDYFVKFKVDYDGDSMGNYTVDVNCFDKNNKSIKTIKSYVDKKGDIKIKLPGVSKVESANVTIYGSDGSTVVYNQMLTYVNVKDNITKDEPPKQETPTTASSSSSSSGATYWASANSDKFHYPSCEWAQKISGKNKIVFHSREDALNSGYQPCQVCGP